MPPSSPRPPEPAPAQSLVPLPDDLPPPEVDALVITSGLCATPQDQDAFDASLAKRQPASG